MEWMKLERKKTNFKTYIRSAAAIFAGILAMEILFLFLPKIDHPAQVGEELFTEWNGISMLISVLHFAGFGILAAVISAKLVIGEYSQKNAAVILCYPIKRNKILNAKCAVICAFTTLSVFLCNTVTIFLGCIIAKIGKLELTGSIANLILTVPCISFFTGVISSCAGILSAAIGQKKHSATAAVVASFLISCVLAQCFSISYTHILAVTAAVCAVMIFAAILGYWILKKEIERLEV